PVRGQPPLGQRRQRGVGTDQGADPRPGRRGAVGDTAGRDGAGPRLVHQPPGVRDRHDRDLLLPHLDTGRDPGRHRPARGRARAGDVGHSAQRPSARPDKPVHRSRRGAAVARWHQSWSHSGSGQCGGGVWPDVRAVARRQPGRPGRQVPEGRCGVSTIELRNVSRWYGNVVAVNDITMTIGPGVTGLLGPNGAGKSTMLHMIAGFLAPSRGELTVGGAASWRNPEIYRTLGLVPERDSVYAFLT